MQIAGSAGSAEPVLMISFYCPKVVLVRLDPELYVKEGERQIQCSGQVRPGRVNRYICTGTLTTLFDDDGW